MEKMSVPTFLSVFVLWPFTYPPPLTLFRSYAITMPSLLKSVTAGPVARLMLANTTATTPVAVTEPVAVPNGASLEEKADGIVRPQETPSQNA